MAADYVGLETTGHVLLEDGSGLLTEYQSVLPVGGVVSSQSFGTLKFRTTFNPVALGSAQNFGSLAFRVKLGSGGVLSPQAFGVPGFYVKGPAQTVQVPGVFHQGATYSAISGQVICGTGWTVGSRTVSTQFGFPRVVYTPQTVIVPGVPRPPVLYSITGQVISGDGHLVGWNNRLFGQPTIAWAQILPLPPVGVPSAQAFGTSRGVGGPVTIPVGAGVPSAQAFGKPLAYLVWFRPPRPPDEALLPSIVCASTLLVPVGWAEEALLSSAEEDLVLVPSVEE